MRPPAFWTLQTAVNGDAAVHLERFSRERPVRAALAVLAPHERTDGASRLVLEVEAPSGAVARLPLAAVSAEAEERVARMRSVVVAETRRGLVEFCYVARVSAPPPERAPGGADEGGHPPRPAP